jgi:hypothetical protein
MNCLTQNVSTVIETAAYPNNYARQFQVERGPQVGAYQA